MASRIRFFLKKALLNGHLQAILAGSFFLGCGGLIERNGVQEFRFADKYGKAQGGSPELLYFLGASIIAVALISALLFRMDELKTERAKTGAQDTLLPEA